MITEMAAKRRDKGTGGVTLRKDGRWQATWTYRDEHDIKRVKTLTGPTKKLAVDKIRDWVAGGGEAQKGGMTVEQIIDKVLAAMEARRGHDSDTIKDYRAFARNHINPRIGKVTVDRLKVAHLDSIANAMIADGKSPKTARNCAIFLGQCMKEGKRLGWIAKDLASDMKPIVVPKFTATIYSLEQVSKLINAAQGSRVQPAIVLAATMGLREAECAGIMWTDIDFKARTLQIERQNKGGARGVKDSTKTEAGMRTIAIPEFVADYLSRLPKKSVFLMTSIDGKKPIHPSSIYHETIALMVAAELPQIRFHDLRHSANNILKQLKVPAETRRDILGHSTTAVTENIYTQTVDWEMHEAMKRLGDAMNIRIG
jgi:integrase